MVLGWETLIRSCHNTRTRLGRNVIERSRGRGKQLVCRHRRAATQQPPAPVFANNGSCAGGRGSPTAAGGAGASRLAKGTAGVLGQTSDTSQNFNIVLFQPDIYRFGHRETLKAEAVSTRRGSSAARSVENSVLLPTRVQRRQPLNGSSVHRDARLRWTKRSPPQHTQYKAG